MPTVISSFLEVIQESKKVAYSALSSFMDYVRTQIPEGADEIEKDLVFYYLGCIGVFEQSMIGNGRLAGKAEAISRMGLRELHDLCAVFHSSEVMIKGNLIRSRGYAMAHMDGVVALYQKHPSYAPSWVGFLENNRNSETFGNELIYRTFDEICIVMKGDRNDLSEESFWLEVMFDARRCIDSIYESSP
jgi:hypothetical protein